MSNLLRGMIAFGALILFTALFSFQHLGPLDFWWWLSGNLFILLLVIFLGDREYRAHIREDFKHNTQKKILWGIASAFLLYGIFWFGKLAIGWVIPQALPSIGDVYQFKNSASPTRIFFLMLLVIGPGEELFWRGFLQRNLQKHLNPWTGFLLATLLYSAIHLPTGNLVLVAAALVCGLFWGFIYLRTNSLLVIIFSHTLWDILVILLLPF